ncbi:MAG: helix-turn-helix transcriptional regulator [Candidatus Tectomicrobia bacterium]|nr:helix-turn-helix transcriptional regulator [Candidatus Tectomicrobia bacterium]
MYLDLKVAIVKSGRLQYQIAQELGVPESRLSKFLRGYGSLRPEQIQQLHAILGLERAENASTKEGKQE